jgi:predicted dehydrogenase
MINISLLGAGYWGSKISTELKKINAVGEIEIVDIKDGKTIHDIKFDNVIVATPAWEHYQQTIELLDKGKNLYVEKPLASTYDECFEISKHVKNQTLMVGHIFLYNDRLRKIKEIIDNGTIGELKYIESNRLNWGRFQKKISTLLSLAPHDMSIIAFILGAYELINAQHKGVKITTDYAQNDIDTYQFQYRGVEIKFNLSWYYPEKIRTMAFIGSKGMISWDEEHKTIKVITDLWKDNWMNYTPSIQILNIESNPLQNELKDFVECVMEKKQPVSDINCALTVAKNLDLLKSFVH